MDKENIKKIKYLIPIFKTIFIERLITKREKMDIRRIYILTESELIIYPPEDPSKIDLYSAKDDYLFYCSWEPLETYYSCIYENSNITWTYVENYLNFIKEYEDSNNLIYSLYVKIFYFKKDYAYSLLCLI